MLIALVGSADRNRSFLVQTYFDDVGYVNGSRNLRPKWCVTRGIDCGFCGRDGRRGLVSVGSACLTESNLITFPHHIGNIRVGVSPVDLRIASPFSLDIVNANASPTSALESIEAKPTFHCHSLNIGVMYTQ